MRQMKVVKFKEHFKFEFQKIYSSRLSKNGPFSTVAYPKRSV